ncbi:hypothetical protein [Neobacillus sp. LXY-1]|uniref:hypothetical protein n=1 Tax=Neobacillus sp. LXY-1 TaxID=3379133 RepID=UPI003EDEA2B3
MWVWIFLIYFLLILLEESIYYWWNRYLYGKNEELFNKWRSRISRFTQILKRKHEKDVNM